MILVVSAALAQVSGGAVPAANGQLFRPTIDGTHTLWADDSSRAPDGYFGARGLLQYARNPVIWTGAESGDVNRLVGDLFQLDLLAGYTKGPVRLGVDVPIYLRNVASSGGESGLGDVALDVKATVLDRLEGPVGLAFSGRAALPTATVEAPLGNRGFAWELAGIVDHETGPFVVTANLGVRGVPREQLENFEWGTQLVTRLGAGYEIVEGAGASFDLGAHLNTADLVADATPVEGILGGWYRIDEFVLRAGVGTGFTSGFGAPQVRTLFSFAYEPPRAVDTDADGIVDRKDECPEDPEDLDGFRDEDGCPEPTMVTLVVQAKGGGDLADAEIAIRGDEAKTVRAGQDVPMVAASYTVDVTAPGYVPLEAQVLNVPDGERHKALYVLEKAIVPAELTVKILDPEGQAIGGATWSVRNETDGPFAGGEMHAFQPGTYQVRVAADGYRGRGFEIALEDGGKTTKDITLEPARVQVKKEKIDIRESIYFETGKAIIKEESFGLLDEVAQAIVDHPELVKIRIEGHTDSRGSASSNLKLSKDRAKSVLEYLVGKGVDAGRLESEGYGESKPIEAGNNEAAWSKNRRVDFFVAERSDEPANPGGEAPTTPEGGEQ